MKKQPAPPTTAPFRTRPLPPKSRIVDFSLEIPSAHGKIVRQVKIKVPVEWDDLIEDWVMTPKALRMVEEAKAKEMGIILPDEMRALRRHLGLTQSQIGELFQVGEKSWTRWENGKYRPNRAISILIRAVADGELPLDYLWENLREPPKLDAAIKPQCSPPGMKWQSSEK